MTIQNITDQIIWTTFFNECGSPSFHQSWEWGELQERLGNEILRIGVYQNKDLIAIAMAIKMRAKRGHFIFVPHGPSVKDATQRMSALKTITEYLKEVALKEQFVFIRIAPAIEHTPENAQLFKDLGYHKAPIYIHSERSWVLDITKSEEELLANMRKTTRYLVKKAMKEGITIEKRTDEKSVDDFWEIYKETFTRENFHPFSKKFITEEFATFKKTNNALFFFGKVPENTPHNDLERPDSTKNDDPPKYAQEGASKYLAGSLVHFTESSAFYYQGASIHTRFPVPYLLQWEAIKEAKKRGCKLYSFYGILIPGRTPKAWSGLTLFKQGFGGYELDYLPTQDYVISPKYWLSYVYEKFLSWKRGV